ncbi:TetR/AcrR family transcriptional regulator [Phytomonospora sp. NPDC050363]|uniref:TetR/AcrR family transcriptional regulator n=1 Tax=Phytomonospora sp. NPDC050363 TaxID=3155642 RepID=UPI0033E96FDE
MSDSVPPSARPPRRADAQRNIDRILDAGLRLYGSAPGVSMSDVAKEAGVGRVTLYTHFPSRADLARAVVERAIDDAVRSVAGLDLSDLPADEALLTLLRTQWHTLDRHRALRGNVRSDVDPDWLRERHDPAMGNLEALVERGIAEGLFRTDLPREWLLAAMYHLIHAAADELSAGRLDEDRAVDVLGETLLSVLRPSTP